MTIIDTNRAKTSHISDIKQRIAKVDQALRYLERNFDDAVSENADVAKGVEALNLIFNSAESDDTIKAGQPVYIKNSGHIGLAIANSAGSAKVAGLAVEDVSPTFSCKYQSELYFQLDDWTNVTGTPALEINNYYFLDAVNPGMITNIAPTTAGSYVVPVGLAVASNILHVDIRNTVLL